LNRSLNNKYNILYFIICCLWLTPCRDVKLQLNKDMFWHYMNYIKLYQHIPKFILGGIHLRTFGFRATSGARTAIFLVTYVHSHVVVGFVFLNLSLFIHRNDTYHDQAMLFQILIKRYYPVFYHISSLKWTVFRLPCGVDH
jgi:hypothetical protein